jgi:hypothetical protein
VAYLGPTPERASYWNANVMIEVGWRIASRLPLILLCDQGPDLPLNLQGFEGRVIRLPRPESKEWADPQPQRTVDSLVRQFRHGHEEQAGRILDLNPWAVIHAATAKLTTPSNLYYTAASVAADEMFGVQFGDGFPRLVGCTMEQFLAGAQKRMHPAQWRAFERDQKKARSKLALWGHYRHDMPPPSVGKVPIVFQYHENDAYNHRAFLPFVIEHYRPHDFGFRGWYSLRILYLNVTRATEKVKGKDGEEYYVCRLDPTGDSKSRLEPLKAAPTQCS